MLCRTSVVYIKNYRRKKVLIDKRTTMKNVLHLQRTNPTFKTESSFATSKKLERKNLSLLIICSCLSLNLLSEISEDLARQKRRNIYDLAESHVKSTRKPCKSLVVFESILNFCFPALSFTNMSNKRWFSYSPQKT